MSEEGCIYFTQWTQYVNNLIIFFDSTQHSLWQSIIINAKGLWLNKTLFGSYHKTVQYLLPVMFNLVIENSYHKDQGTRSGMVELGKCSNQNSLILSGSPKWHWIKFMNSHWQKILLSQILPFIKLVFPGNEKFLTGTLGTSEMRWEQKESQEYRDDPIFKWKKSTYKWTGKE